MSLPATIRVMTWNIHGGVGPDRRHDLERVVDLIQQTDPDIVALQEIDSRRSKGSDHPIEVLKRALGHHGVAAAAILTSDGDYGQVLLSRWPFQDSQVHDISYGKREPRRAITAIVSAPAGQVFVLATHLGLKFAERRTQCARLTQLLEQSKLVTVALGDFNDWLWPGSVQNALKKRLPGRTHKRTFPARFPLLKLDRVFIRPAAALLRSWVVPAGAEVSDHLPLVAEIDLNPHEPSCSHEI